MAANKYSRRTPEQKRAYWREYYLTHREQKREYRREYYLANREQLLEQMRAYRATLPPDERRAYMKDYHLAHREEARRQKREDYLANREKLLEKQRAADAKRPDGERRAYDQTYNLKHREEKREYRRERYKRNREQILAERRAYHVVHAEKLRDRARAARSRRLGAEGGHTAADLADLFRKQGGKCPACYTAITKSGPAKYHIDHVLPLSRGGSDDAANLQLLCGPCNQSKHAKDPYEWANAHGLLFV